jgi:hypothetical protein
MPVDHGTYLGTQYVRGATPGQGGPLYFARCQCGWEGPHRIPAGEGVAGRLGSPGRPRAPGRTQAGGGVTVARLQMSDRQWLVLTPLDLCHPAAVSPQYLAGEVERLGLSWYGRPTDAPYQGVARTVASLISRGLAKRAYQPSVTYAITTEGREAARQFTGKDHHNG